MKNDHDAFLSRGCHCAPQPHTRQLDVFRHSCNKLDVFDWLKNINAADVGPTTAYVEVRFKNSRKDFFIHNTDLELKTGDIVAVEASPGHDIGIISLTGELVKIQMKSKGVNPDNKPLKRVYRRAKVSDIEKWVTAVKQEDSTMFRSREIASSLKLDMKISDVEYQGDRTKAIFYYTADDRVDFRELIKVLADAFGVRIEMRQIGMRQEASRLGGIGSCGRELCCSSWLTRFKSVSTNSARTQQLSLNPQKLAGQCSKLKCCINYENACYEDILKDFPGTDKELITKKGVAIWQKTDVLKRLIGYEYKEMPGKIHMLPVERVKEILAMNARNQHPDDLSDGEEPAEDRPDTLFNNGNNNLEDSLTRFDKPHKKSKNKRRKKRSRGKKNTSQ
ncbi:MAG: regulatory iron-sulfur-containing complex subunit RicT [Bacteroidales bacterium]|nr:regulatory iron-sulfur-containing complex subunit RicT [Bacteroidales bacterium]